MLGFIPELIKDIWLIIGALLTLYFANMAIKGNRLIKLYEPRVRQLMTMLGASGHRTVQNANKYKARNKLADNLRKKAPFGMLNNFSDNEVVALLSDQQLMSGAVNIAGMVGGGLRSLLGRGENDTATSRDDLSPGFLSRFKRKKTLESY